MAVIGMLQLPAALGERERDLVVLRGGDGPDAVDGSPERHGVLPTRVGDVVRPDEILQSSAGNETFSVHPDLQYF